MLQTLRAVLISMFLMFCLTAKPDSLTKLTLADSISTRLSDTITTVTPPSAADSALIADSITFSHLPWYQQLFVNGFKIHDPHVNYPKFPRFLLSVYDWADDTFNSYNPNYVVGTGSNWKVTVKSFNWMESYMMMFSAKTSEMLHIRSDLYYDFGVYLSFMAVSVGYTAKLNKFLSGGNNNRKNFNFNFTCSRIYANLDIASTKGNAKITHFGDLKNKNLLPYKFNDIDHYLVSGEAFYIFNYSKYSHAAAYSFSKYQLKSAGSWLMGFAFNHQDIKIDFTNLPQQMKDHLPHLEDNYHFRYTDYALCGGHAHNWVLKPRKWLINLTLFPAMGYRHAYHNSSDSRKHLLASSLHGRTAMVFNHRSLFASLTGRIDMSLYFNSRSTFFNSIESLSFIVGARF
ncbi:MAG: DUF4421 domain-containing protein [Firmicutes bacterium]|nr:DUF4421 domain-containing protein [Bacillota bacterium]MCM1401428.1 DUF4421 domain-containing protein [Bacteroides sp.]